MTKYVVIQKGTRMGLKNQEAPISNPLTKKKALIFAKHAKMYLPRFDYILKKK